MHRLYLILFPLLVMGCGDGSDGDSTCEPIDPSTYPLNMEMWEMTGLITRNVYTCRDCTREQFDSIVPPRGWKKNVPNRILSTQNSLERFEVEGVPTSVDFIAEIPGNEWEFIAVVEGVSFESGAPVATVRRNTVFTFPACSRFHRLTDRHGRVFVLFAVIDDLLKAGLDLTAEDAFADRNFPVGWTYDSEVLKNDLTVDSGGSAQVYNHNRESTWQLVP